MQLVDRIEKRRFVGREFLLWLWCESELFDATLTTKEHGAFGLWIERQIVLSAGKEVTRIKGSQPASGREAKEAILRGKLPETAGLHLSMGERETTLTLKAEHLSVAGMKLPTVLGGADDEPPQLLDEPGGRAPRPAPKPRRRAGGDAAAEARQESDEDHETFYERMHLTVEIEAVLHALYRDFLVLRLGPAWDALVTPVLRAWAAGEAVDADAYRAQRTVALTPAGARRARAR